MIKRIFSNIRETFMTLRKKPARASDACSLVSYGEENPDKTFYVIWREPLSAGFFANLMHVLGHVAIARRYGAIPVIDMQNYRTFYNEDEKIHGTLNAWEYYFFQPDNFALDDAYRSKNVLLCSGVYPFEELVYLNKTSEYDDLFQKNIVLKPYIKEAWHDFISSYFCKGRILGVHARGTDMKKARGHPTPPTIDACICCTKEIMRTQDIDAIFVCTDEEQYLQKFLSVFGKDKIIYTEAFRSKSGKKLHAKTAFSLREHHLYNLGREVLLDALVLSSCSSLLCGKSNISVAAMNFNNGRYESVKILDNGINP